MGLAIAIACGVLALAGFVHMMDRRIVEPSLYRKPELKAMVDAATPKAEIRMVNRIIRPEYITLTIRNTVIWKPSHYTVTRRGV